MLYIETVQSSQNNKDAKEDMLEWGNPPIHRMKKIAWWQLSLVGVGCISGTGFFLASGLAIKSTGPSVLLAFVVVLLGAVGLRKRRTCLQ